MKLSIITINFNNVDGLRKTAESIVAQTFQDFEWIVVDGGSTDGSKELIERFDGRVTWWCSEKDSGIYNAMNKGVSHASGTYVLFLNSGDWLADEKVLADFNNACFDKAIIYGNVYLMKGDHCVYARKIGELSFGYMLYSSISHSSSFIPRDLLLRCPYNENYKIVSDWEFWLKMILQGEKFTYFERFVSCFDLAGVSQTNLKLNDYERQDVIDKIIPRSILYDYQSEKIGQLAKQRRKHPMFSKFITLCTIVMRELDSFFIRNQYKDN